MSGDSSVMQTWVTNFCESTDLSHELLWVSFSIHSWVVTHQWCRPASHDTHRTAQHCNREFVNHSWVVTHQWCRPASHDTHNTSQHCNREFVNRSWVWCEATEVRDSRTSPHSWDLQVMTHIIQPSTATESLWITHECDVRLQKFVIRERVLTRETCNPLHVMTLISDETSKSSHSWVIHELSVAVLGCLMSKSSHSEFVNHS